MPSLPNSKRSACDRCRLHKLRCPPSADGTEACTRCKRLGARCITSYPRRPNGTPQTITQSQGQPKLRPKATNALQSPASTATSTSSMSRLSTTAAARTNTPTAYEPASFVTDTSIPYESLPASLDEISDHFTQAGTLRLETWGILNDDTIGSLFTNDNSNLHSPSMFGIEGGDSSLDFSDSLRHVQYSCIDDSSTNQHDSILQCNTRLSNLNLDLSKRLQQCLGSNDNNSVGDRDGINTTFERALGDLSEFLSVIRSYTTKNEPAKGASTGEPVMKGVGSGPEISPTRRISLVVFLNLLSAYLQIVAVYDKIIGAFRTRLCSVGSLSSSCGGSGHRASDLRLFGLSAGQGTLQTKILIHAVLHQFDVIERMLGLPADLRVTDAQGAYLGLFEDERARSLLGAVSNAKRIETGWAQGQTSMEDHGGTKALSTLRVTLKVVHDLLDT